MARISRRRLALFGSALVVAAAAGSAFALWARHPDGSPQAFVITADAVRPKVLIDLRRSFERAAPKICTALETPCRFRVSVRVFEDQERFDPANPEMAGSFAFSGNRTIQIVSPLEAARRGVSYADGLMIAAHESTHLALNEVNPRLDDWLQEGAAVYFGPRLGRNLYDRACRRVSPHRLPALAELTQHYHVATSADLHAYTLIASHAHRFGDQRINDLIRSRDSVPAALGTSRRRIDADWHAYVRKGCVH